MTIPDASPSGSPIAAGTAISVLDWDAGRLLVNADYADWLRDLGRTTADAWLTLEDGEVYRAVGERVTSRQQFPHAGTVTAVYRKRHGRLTWRECWKSYVRLQRPVWGARPEWDAILEFHRLGIPTMTPILCAEVDGRSCLVTAELANCHRLDHWFRDHPGSTTQAQRLRRDVVTRMAMLTQRLHRAGWHHQDLYWCHVLWPVDSPPTELHLIDLGRVQPHRGWNSRRWIVKDLAQLQFSSSALSATEQLRFLRTYLGRRLTARDRPLIRQILRKAARIARHTSRHGL